jgi:hypothetical protein
MIRTDTVSLSTIDAIAYRKKMPSGGSGLVIIRRDVSQPGIATMSKTSGEAIVANNVPRESYPRDAFVEAAELTRGLPYRKQGPPRIDDWEAPAADAPDDIKIDAVVSSEDYGKIVEHYTDKSGRLSYDLINKDLIKLLHSSSVVSRMLEDDEIGVDEIRSYLVGAHMRHVSGNDRLDNDQIEKISELLDEVSPKGVYKELDHEIIRALQARPK